MSTKPDFDALMHEICVGMGFCGCIKRGSPLHVTSFIPSTGVVSADQFAEWVFLADNLNPNTDRKSWGNHKNKLKSAFLRHMGAETVDAKSLQYSFLEGEYTAKVAGPLYRKIEVWRPYSSDQMRRYNCIQYIPTAEYLVLTVDFVDAAGSNSTDQARYFFEALIEFDRNDPEPQHWSHSLEGAIAYHEQAWDE
ncbi:MAG: hypothetical protein AAGC95_02635 [Pseudomonadota bacterium]